MSRGRLLQDPGLPARNPTKSLWQSPPHSELYGIQSASLPSKQDVVVLGSGITGCSVSWWLMEGSKDLSVSVLDAREICSGASGRNGGRINCTAVQDFDKYRRIFGDEVAVSIVRFELSHLDALVSFAKELGPELEERSEVRRVDAIAAVFEEEKFQELTEQLRNFERAFPDLKGHWKMIGRRELVEKYGIVNGRGALVGRAGAAWPYRLITDAFQLLRSKNKGRFSLEANTPALSIKRGSDPSYPYEVSTPRGTIKAKHVVHCTEGHSSHLLPLLRGILVPRRGEMTVQTPASGFPEKSSLSWSFLIGNGLDYATQNPKTGVIFIGGGETNRKDEMLGLSSDAEEDILSLSHLGGILPAAFGHDGWGAERPGKRRIIASWTGILCNSLDHVPIVGMLPQELLDRPAGSTASAEWISAGYGGYGMVNAFLSAKALANMILSQDVSSSLPKPFFITPQRAERLKRTLDRFLHSKREHARALL